MRNLKTVLSVALLMFTVVLFAQDGEVVEATAPGTIVEWLTPFIVLAATWLVRLVKPLIPSWATLVVVAGLSSAVAAVTALTIGGDMGFFVQVALGLLSVFVHQTYRAFTGNQTTVAVKKK